MFTKTLSKNAAGTLAILGESGILNDAYLAGGTACALQIGHRVSLDLDFFTEKEFLTEVVLKQLTAICPMTVPKVRLHNSKDLSA